MQQGPAPGRRCDMGALWAGLRVENDTGRSRRNRLREAADRVLGRRLSGALDRWPQSQPGRVMAGPVPSRACRGRA